ncbi:Leucine-responsive regulatory protein [Aquisphaera giovannonii]|uniref:Leucine-responsive regulatory protein n=1 Tax=Aquisphaera giovannonii TaxID=406548 RepID=A0A5B9VX35_9BACT|nr:Lrp/AsnC family transcriptional regulator [Aquisphaera giovannonii]QEH32946.1 Leucine-responsive regulatory protein [Aquisphaera giovannonii]
MIDDVDCKILNHLQGDARISNAELARRVGMAPSGVLERVKKLEERGLIRGYEARLDARKLGSGLVAFAFVRSDDRVGGIESAEALAAIPEVQEVHHIAGEDCYLIKIRGRTWEALGRLLRRRSASSRRSAPPGRRS